MRQDIQQSFNYRAQGVGQVLSGKNTWPTGKLGYVLQRTTEESIRIALDKQKKFLEKLQKNKKVPLRQDGAGSWYVDRFRAGAADIDVAKAKEFALSEFNGSYNRERDQLLSPAGKKRQEAYTAEAEKVNAEIRAFYSDLNDRFTKTLDALVEAFYEDPQFSVESLVKEHFGAEN